MSLIGGAAWVTYLSNCCKEDRYLNFVDLGMGSKTEPDGRASAHEFGPTMLGMDVVGEGGEVVAVGCRRSPFCTQSACGGRRRTLVVPPGETFSVAFAAPEHPGTGDFLPVEIRAHVPRLDVSPDMDPFVPGEVEVCAETHPDDYGCVGCRGLRQLDVVSFDLRTVNVDIRELAKRFYLRPEGDDGR